MHSRIPSTLSFALGGLVIFSFPLGCGNSKSPIREGPPIHEAGVTMTPEVHISAQNKGGDIVVELKIVNHGSASFCLLKWNFPQDGRLTTNLFEVRHNNEIVEYKGPMVKRRVTDADFLKIEPGREYTASLGLAQGYELETKGRYTIQYKAWNEAPGGGEEVVPLSSNITELDR
jgi:hypothetical protein